MPSAYTAHIGLNQETAKKLAEIEPFTEDSLGLFCKKIIVDYAEKKLVYANTLQTGASLKDDLIRARIEDLKTNTLAKKLFIQTQLVHVYHKSPDIAVEVANGRMSLENAGIQTPKELQLTTKSDNSNPQQSTTTKFVSNESPYDEHYDSKKPDGTIQSTLQCTTCGILGTKELTFDFIKGNFESFSNAQKNYITHIDNIHLRKITQAEEDAFVKLAGI